MAFPGNNYAPPGTYTQTNYDNPTQALLQGLRIPLLLGTGSEILTQNSLELVRGSSQNVDQRIVGEDATDHAVASISSTGAITLGSFDGVLDTIQTRHYPIVTGGGTGTTATSPNAVSVTINGTPIVVLRITGTTGLLKLASAPESGDEVRVTYYFKRTDTRITDNLSDQVSEEGPVIYGMVGQSYEILSGVNDTLKVTVDDAVNEITITLTPSIPAVPWTASQIAAFINSGASSTSLVASTYVDNFGQTALKLVSDRNIVIGNGTANSTLGLTNGLSTARNKVFYTFQRPIVDGSNGGITTTDPADVSVTVDGVVARVVSVDGQNGALTLAFAPEVGATVAATYYFNSWQDTYDYLAHLNVTDVTLCGATPDRSDYVNGVDFVLHSVDGEDVILWGTAVTVNSGLHTTGTTLFHDSQITGTLVDAREYLAECAPVTNTSVSPPVTSKTQFTLPLTPTTGNGRNTPLGTSLFQTVSNSRIDLPTNRPDLVSVYWGFGIQDAMDRGAVKVTKVDSSTNTVTLASPVPVGASVYATFYYNTIQDQVYTFTVDTAGAAGVGTYTIQDEDGTSLLTARYGTKSAALTGITLQFPSGSERLPDARFESPFDTTYFEEPVEETVTVTFSTEDSSLAMFTVPDPGPYYPITNASDHVRIKVDGVDLAAAAAGIDLSNIGGVGDLGFHAQIVGNEVAYDATSGKTTYEIDATNSGVNLTLDGVLLQSSALMGTTQDLSDFVNAINEAATGHASTAQAGGASTITLKATASDVDDYYVDWYVTCTNNLPPGVEGQIGQISDYDGTTKVATVSAPWGTQPTNATTYHVWNDAVLPQYKSGTQFDSATVIAVNQYNVITLHYTGSTTGASGNIPVTLTAGPYNSASLLATAMEADIELALIAAGAGFRVSVEADADARLLFQLHKDPLDAGGYLEFITPTTQQATGTVVINSAPLAALDTITIGGQALTGVAGVRTPGNDDFDTTGGTVQAIATEVAAAINDALNSFTAICTALAVDDTVVLTAVPVGVLGNAVALASVTTPAGGTTVSGAFLEDGSNVLLNNFAVLAGIDTDTATGGDQTKVVDGPVARRFTLAGDNTSALTHDRIILRNRLCPGQSTVDAQVALDQCELTIEGSSGYALTGLTVNEQGQAGWKATVRPATLLGYVGFASGQVAAGTYSDARDGQPVVTFYAAGGTTAQNNVFKFTFDGVPVTVLFTDAAGVAIAAGGTADVPVGPATTANTVIYQIAAAMASAGLGANAGAVIAAGLVRQEGAGIRFRSGLYTPASAVVIGTGNANDTLGFSDGQSATRTGVDPEVLVSALMGYSGATVVAKLLTTWVAAPTATYFAAEALAKTVTDDAGSKYLFLESQGTSGLGVSSSLAWFTATTHDVMAQGVGLGVEAGDGATGEAGISGYYVTSSDPVDGSGTANTSLFNSGVGQDGVVGQTYRDLVTGLTFTVLPRSGGINYPSGSSFTLEVRQVVTTDSNLPINTIPGVSTVVTNTLGVGVGDTALVETHVRSGNEPAIGDLYYATYNYTKQDFTTRLWTKFSLIEAAYGTNGAENPVTLASYLALLNGAVLLAIKQVQKDTDEDSDGNYDSASITAFTNAVDDVEGAITGDVYPDILVPLDYPSASMTAFFQYLARHCDIQSTIRYRAERTALAGFPSGTGIRLAGDTAQAIARSRFRVVYPDMVTVVLTDAEGQDSEYLVDGGYLASGLSGSIVSPTVDVATPWTGRRMFGYGSLGRILDAVEMNQVAIRGVTLIEDKTSYLKVRHGLTTDMSSPMTKLPTITQIADEVQRQARQTLDRFVGTKFLPGVLSQIEGQLSNTLKLLTEAEILSAYTGVKAQPAADDPSTAEIEAAYAPVWPLLYLLVQFAIRSSLG